MPDEVDEVIGQLAVGGVVAPASVRGCSDADIVALENELGVTLPRTYRSFLAKMGKSAGDFLCGTDFLYPDLPLRRYAEDLLSDSEEPLALEPDDFVFAMHQGYSFLFFRCGISDDPPVFLYDENKPSFERVAYSFSSWLASAARDEIALAAELRK